FVRPAGLRRSATADTSAARLAEAPNAESGAMATGSRVFVRAPTGSLRLADGLLAAQVGWLFPLALAGVFVGTLGILGERPVAPHHLAVILWAGWALTYGVVYSAAGGIFHFYYLATMAPPLAALAGIGAARGWDEFAKAGWRATILPVALLLTAIWQTYVEWSALRATPERARILLYVAPAATALLAVLLLLLAVRRRSLVHGGPPRGLAAGTAIIALLGLLTVPLAWALSSVVVPGVPILPSADLYRLAATEARARVKSQDDMLVQKLIAFLKSRQQGERYLITTSSARLAAPIIIETGDSVMARGGF